MDCSSVRQKIICFDGDSRTAIPAWHLFSPRTINYSRGVSGCSSAMVVSRCASYGYLTPPTAAVIEVGINDLSLYSIGEAATIANIKLIVDWYLLHAKRVYVCSPYPVNINICITGILAGASWGTVSFLTTLNSTMQNVANALQTFYATTPNVQFVDLRPTSSPAGELLAAYTFDGIHGTNLMNQLICDSVMAYENNYPAGL